jgi:hypothetical protein
MLDLPCERSLEYCSIFKHTHVISGPLGCSAVWGFGSIRPRSCKPWIVSANPNDRKFKTKQPYSYFYYEADFIHYLLPSEVRRLQLVNLSCPFDIKCTSSEKNHMLLLKAYCTSMFSADICMSLIMLLSKEWLRLKSYST